MDADPKSRVNLLDLAKKYTAAWCSSDPARVAAFYSPDGSLTVNDAAPAVGTSAIAQVAQGFMASFPDMQVIMDDLIIDGDHTVYHWTLTGTNNGPGGTGNPVRISGHEKWKIGVDGLIAESLGYFDDALYQHQLQHGL